MIMQRTSFDDDGEQDVNQEEEANEYKRPEEDLPHESRVVKEQQLFIDLDLPHQHFEARDLHACMAPAGTTT